MSRQIRMRKAEETEEIKQLIQRYEVVGIASLQKVRAVQLQELKKKLKGSLHLRVIKNTIMKRAIAECKDKPNVEKLGNFLSGSNIFLFTNINPFKLALLLEKGRVKATARAGDIATMDIIVPAGNTGLPPGPIISQLGLVGLPTRIESGSVWVNKDTLVAKKGEVIDARLASVLSKLNIKPIEAGLIMKVAYDDGLIITEEQLHLDLDGFKKQIIEAQTNAFNLALNCAYPLPENIQLLIQAVHRMAYSLALSTAIPTSETLGDMLRKASIEATSLSAKLPKIEEKTEIQSKSQSPITSPAESPVQKG